MNTNVRVKIIFTLSAINLILILTACSEDTNSLGNSTPVTLTLDTNNSIPSSNQTGVSVKPSITIAVMEDLDMNTVTKDTVHLMPGENHNMGETSSDDDALEDNNMDVISGTVNFNENSKQITIIPNSLLAQGQTYHIHLAGVKLKNGTPVEDGMHSIHYSFTTAHAHEVRRLDFEPDGTITRETITEVNQLTNRRSKRTRYDGAKDNGIIDRIDYYDTTLNGRNVSRYRTDASGVIEHYQAQIIENGIVVANASYRDNGDTDYFNDPLSGYWTPDLTEGDHEITFHYTANDRDNGALWSSNPENDFSLRHVSLMEMNHAMAVSNDFSGNFQHRHIFYSDVGDDGVDLNANGNPAPNNDKVRVYHTRDMENGIRTRSWSWYGTDAGEGQNGILFDDDDLAYRVRVYEYDNLGRRSKRTTYSVSRRNNEPGKTRSEWETIINSTADPHSYREYTYDPVSNVLTRMREYEYDDNGNEFMEEERFYSTN